MITNNYLILIIIKFIDSFEEKNYGHILMNEMQYLINAESELSCKHNRG